MAEIRLDTMNCTSAELQKIFDSHSGLIATCRPQNISLNEQYSILLQAIEYGAAFVDIEFEAPDDHRFRLLEAARKHNCRIIISYHNYQITPTLGVLRNIIDSIFDMGADIVKIACMANTTTDSARVLSLYEHYTSLVAICMGEYGKITRFAAPMLGAPFTFAAYAEGLETAPGQLTYNFLNSVIKNL